ncbi:MAG: glycosyltransferase [Mycobacterium pseudokansasii]|uniref:N-acetyl-alpha-D-glucosaminyl L-malate synthase n=1 Tax=Mycobacterium pseudokansasii TaxID=2341080 RepID=A0A498R038_9MYCO|nr:glycosyltransferase [Mycobacterium pseudokansasii]KZS61032.1 glycosyl transferase family 1 [Mycobacterium kansasii]MBY0388340.1 glycosyltransferase [Mycobacterium pseudokansasii]VBA30062.1 N-acetyl-alpha-D-glucosaminyl L-malate synthase [Mycobacterium pseudokansasii]VBA31648.1 N-acetyl-alpha-D-glucosaminyl L-malate synthase [Mycobacterium pseudokansasii]VBA54192.1 N-acetyl-alpha-D-glucosaminyl L-malate synthase [Mycobacterium pseudokansasii]
MTREVDRAYLKPPVGDTAALPSTRSLAVLIVTCGDHDLLETCLGSVAEHVPGLTVYVHENSGEAFPGREELAARYKGVHWVSGQVTLGFAAAFNSLVEHTPSDADLLLLNADARLRGPLTRTRELLHLPRVAAVSPMVDDNTAPARPPWDIATRRLTPSRALVAAAGYAGSLRGTPISALYARQPAESRGIRGVLGATCLAISRAAWNTVGGFDEEFVNYGAAADWQSRARAAGWRVLLADELGAEQSDPATGGGAGHRRDRDLAQADTALQLEHQHSVHHADVYLAGAKVLERLQVSRRGAGVGARTGQRNGLPAIVIATNRLVYGGAERQKALLATELDRRGYPVTVVCVQRFGPLIDEIPPSVRVVRQPWWAPIIDLPPGPAVLISGDTNTETGFATLWRAAARSRRWLVAAHIPPEDDRPIYSRPLVAAMRRADGFIVLAQRHWDMLTAHHRLGERRFVVPNGVVATDDPAPPIRTVGDPPHLVMLSRIVEHKNPHLLIEALGGLADMRWKLSIFGDGPDRERLQARTPTELRDRVQWRGWSPGPGPALADADLLCVPSRSEAFPLVILEAMARAVPVAASAVCAVPEMLDFGRAGFVIEPVSVLGWREHLARILAAPTALPSVGRLGFARMRQHYTVQAMTDAYLDAIDAVL